MQEVSIRISGAVVKYSLTQLGSTFVRPISFGEVLKCKPHRKNCDFFGMFFDTKIMVAMFVFICYRDGLALTKIPLKIGDFELKTSGNLRILRLSKSTSKGPAMPKTHMISHGIHTPDVLVLLSLPEKSVLVSRSSLQASSNCRECVPSIVVLFLSAPNFNMSFLFISYSPNRSFLRRCLFCQKNKASIQRC